MGDKAGVSEDGWAGSTVGVTHSYQSQVPRLCWGKHGAEVEALSHPDRATIVPQVLHTQPGPQKHCGYKPQICPLWALYVLLCV